MAISTQPQQQQQQLWPASVMKGGAGAIQDVQEHLRRFDAALKQWMRQQPMPVEVTLVTATSALQGGAIGALMGTFTADVAASLPQQTQGLNAQAAASLQKAQAFAGGPLVQARNFAVMTGVNAGLTCAMKRLRGGVEDAQTSMIAAFGSGAMFSLVSGMGGPDVATNALTTGIFFALFQGGLFKIGQKFSKPPENDVNYLQSRSILHNLGLQRYEKNFKKGLLTDATIPLINDSALRDVNIPPGPRLLILDHIKRHPEMSSRE